jgi:hypothetical protein
LLINVTRQLASAKEISDRYFHSEHSQIKNNKITQHNRQTQAF